MSSFISRLSIVVNTSLPISGDFNCCFFHVHSFPYQKSQQEVSLLLLNSIEFQALKNYYKHYNNGLSATPADFIAQLAAYVGTEEKEVSGQRMSQITGYSSTRCYEYLAQAKIAGLVKRRKTKNSKIYSIKIDIPDFLLPCTNGLSQLILDKLQNAYGLDLVFTRDCINRITSRSTLIEPSVINDAIDSLVNTKKLYLQKDMNILFPKLQHDLQQKSHYLIIDDITKDFSDLNNQQCSFIGYLKQVSRVLSNSNSNSNSNSCLSQLLSCHFLNKEKQLQGVFA